MGSCADACPFLLDFTSCAEAWVDQFTLTECLQSRGVGRDSRGLAQGITVPVESEPVQIFFDAIVEFFPHSRAIDVFMAEVEYSVGLSSKCESDTRGQGVTQMHQPSGTWGEASSNHHELN